MDVWRPGALGGALARVRLMFGALEPSVVPLPVFGGCFGPWSTRVRWCFGPRLGPRRALEPLVVPWWGAWTGSSGWTKVIKIRGAGRSLGAVARWRGGAYQLPTKGCLTDAYRVVHQGPAATRREHQYSPRQKYIMLAHVSLRFQYCQLDSELNKTSKQNSISITFHTLDTEKKKLP